MMDANKMQKSEEVGYVGLEYANLEKKMYQ